MDEDVRMVMKAVLSTGQEDPGLGPVADVLESEYDWILQGDECEDERLDEALLKGMRTYWDYEPKQRKIITTDNDGRQQTK